MIIREDPNAALTIADLTPQAHPSSVLSDAEMMARKADPASGLIVISLSQAADVWLLREPGIRRIYKLAKDEWSQLDADEGALVAAHFAPMPRVMFVPWVEAKLLIAAGVVHSVIADAPTELSRDAIVWPHLGFAPAPVASGISERRTVHIVRYGGAAHDRDSPLALIAFARALPSSSTCTITGQLDEAEAEVLEQIALSYGMSARVLICVKSQHRINAETIIALRDDRDEPLDPHVLGAVERGCSLVTLGWPEERACFSDAHFLSPLCPPLSLDRISPEGLREFLAAHRGAVFTDLETALRAPQRKTTLRPWRSLSEALLHPKIATPDVYLPEPRTAGPLALEPNAKKQLRQIVADPTSGLDLRWRARALKLGLVTS